jgi:hypothetical protein
VLGPLPGPLALFPYAVDTWPHAFLIGSGPVGDVQRSFWALPTITEGGRGNGDLRLATLSVGPTSVSGVLGGWAVAAGGISALLRGESARVGSTYPTTVALVLELWPVGASHSELVCVAVDSTGGGGATFAPFPITDLDADAVALDDLLGAIDDFTMLVSGPPFGVGAMGVDASSGISGWRTGSPVAPPLPGSHFYFAGLIGPLPETDDPTLFGLYDDLGNFVVGTIAIDGTFGWGPVLGPVPGGGDAYIVARPMNATIFDSYNPDTGQVSTINCTTLVGDGLGSVIAGTTVALVPDCKSHGSLMPFPWAVIQEGVVSFDERLSSRHLGAPIGSAVLTPLVAAFAGAGVDAFTLYQADLVTGELGPALDYGSNFGSGPRGFGPPTFADATASTADALTFALTGYPDDLPSFGVGVARLSAGTLMATCCGGQPVRQRQRDDGLTTGASRARAGRNRPTSVQASIRQRGYR